MKVRYLETRKRARSKDPVYVVNPPKYVKSIVQGAAYRQFADRQEAIDYAINVHDAFKSAKKSTQEYSDIAGSALQRPISYVDKGSVQGLVHHYFGTRHWQVLKTGSKEVYRRVLRIALAMKLSEGSRSSPVGEMLARSFSASAADRLHERLVKEHSKQTANLACTVMRRVWAVGLRHGLVSVNPFSTMGLSSTPSRTVLWEPDEIDLFIKTADDLGYHCVGTLALMCYTFCQRPGDMRNLTWSNVTVPPTASQKSVLQFTQEKTGSEIELEIPENITKRLDKYHSKGHKSDSYIIRSEATGCKLTRQSMYRRVRHIKEVSGLRTELSIGDLRRTGATELAEAGASEDELRVVTGHKSREVLSVYVRPTKKLAANAMKKRFG